MVGPTYLSDIAVDDIYFSKGTCCQLKQGSFDAGLIGESLATISSSANNSAISIICYYCLFYQVTVHLTKECANG